MPSIQYPASNISEQSLGSRLVVIGAVGLVPERQAGLNPFGQDLYFFVAAGNRRSSRIAGRIDFLGFEKPVSISYSIQNVLQHTSTPTAPVDESLEPNFGMDQVPSIRKLRSLSRKFSTGKAQRDTQ